MERRSKLETYLEVLQIIKSGTSKPTRIMYNANISWQPLMRVLGSMMDQELVREIDVSATKRKRDKRTTRLYEITMKGEQVVRYFRGAKELGIDENLIHVWDSVVRANSIKYARARKFVKIYLSFPSLRGIKFIKNNLSYPYFPYWTESYFSYARIPFQPLPCPE